MTTVLCELKDIRKEFGIVKALNGVNFDLRMGEVHALMGENGAGKSTLMKIISGAYPPTAGEIFIEGHKTILKNPHHARELGISIVHQEPQMVPALSIAENVCLGYWPAKSGVVTWSKMLEESEKLCSQIGLKKPVTTLVEELSMAEKQMIQIARALMVTSKILILDEPTSSLTPQEKDALFSIIKKLKQNGMALVYISHRMEEIFEICDRITVLKDGQFVKTVAVHEVDNRELVRMMVGRPMEQLYPPKGKQFGEEILKVDGLERKGAFRNVSFTLRKGEVLGFAGLVGSGRTEVAMSLFGYEPADSGSMILKGKSYWPRNTAEAINHGMALVGEDRHQGMVHVLSVQENMTLPSYNHLSKLGIIDRLSQKKKANEFVDKLRVRTPNVEQQIGNLSGGNQQKVIFARWLVKDTEVFILDEPTRGVDVGAKAEIYQLIRHLASEGKGVILISSELPEVLGMSDRVLVMHNGTVAGILEGEKATEENITELAIGVK